MLIPQWLQNPSCDIYLQNDFLTLDFETIANDGRYGSANDGRNQFALACWKFRGKIHSKWGGEFEQGELLEAIKSASFVVAHSSKFEFGWLRRMGAQIESIPVFDTAIAEYVLLGNLVSGDAKRGLRPISISLDSCRSRRNWQRKDPIVDLWLKHGVTVDEMPTAWVEARCKSDVESTERLFLDQLRRLRRTNRLPVQYTRCLLVSVLADIESHGMHLDREVVLSTHAQYTRRLAELSKTMEEMTSGINWRSTKQAAVFIYDTLAFAELADKRGNPKRTPGGARATSNKVLEKLRADTPRQRDFLALRKDLGKCSAALSKNLNYFKGVIDDPSTGDVFKAEINQTRTATHRTSSTGIPTDYGSVQFQNLPRGFKVLFSPRNPGWKIAEADSAQLEFRVAALLGHDAQATRDIEDVNWDAHVTSAAAMAGVGYGELYASYKSGDKGAAEKRQDAKPETFKPLYGGQKGTPAQERWYKEFRQRYPELAKVQKDWVHEVSLSKRLITPWGMRFYFPHARVSDYGYCNVNASVYNYPVQSLATAEIIPIAMVYLWHRIKTAGYEDRIMLVNTVHDSVAAELDPELAGWFEQACIEAFTMDVYRYLRQVYGLDFTIPLGCGVKIGDHLGEGKESAVDVYPDGRQVRRK